MESNIIIIGVIAIVFLNLAFYFFIKKKKAQKELDDYLKKGRK
jgi:preprotein translocase subunit YajC